MIEQQPKTFQEYEKNFLMLKIAGLIKIDKIYLFLFPQDEIKFIKDFNFIAKKYNIYIKLLNIETDEKKKRIYYQRPLMEYTFEYTFEYFLANEYSLHIKKIDYRSYKTLKGTIDKVLKLLIQDMFKDVHIHKTGYNSELRINAIIQRAYYKANLAVKK